MNSTQNFFPFAQRLRREILLMDQVAVSDFLGELHPMLAEGDAFKYLRDKAAPVATIDESGIAVLPIYGALAYRPSAFELITGLAEDSRRIAEAIFELGANPKVKGVVLDVDSPGGFVTGGPEIASAVYVVSAGKPVVTWTGGSLCSLAYMFGCRATRVLATQSARIGSIGAMVAFTDLSRLTKNVGIEVQVFTDSGSTEKGIGYPGTPLEQPDKDKIQAGLDETAAMFRNLVREARPQIAEDDMRAQVFGGEEALKRGLIDDLCLSLAQAKSACRALINS